MKNSIHSKSFIVLFMVIFIRNGALSQEVTWEQTNGPLGGAVVSLAINGNWELFAGTVNGGILRSTNNGVSWQPIGSATLRASGRLVPVVSKLAINSKGDIFAGTRDDFFSDIGGGVFRSTDNGDTWTQVNSGLPTYSAIFSLIIDSNDVLLAGDQAGLARSTDNGETWVPIDNGLQKFVQALAINPQGHIFAGTSRGAFNVTEGVFRSTDNGDTWTETALTGIGNAPTAVKVRDLAITSTGTVFAATGNPFGSTVTGVFRSTDNGDSWTRLGNGLTSKNYEVLIIKSNGDIFAGQTGLWLGSPGDGIFRSSDDGDSWTQISTGIIATTDVFSFAINSGGDLFTGTSLDGLYQSTNNGDSWTRKNEGIVVTDVSDLVSNSDGELFALTYDGMYRSANNGDDWMAINAGLDGLELSTVYVSANGRIYVGTRSNGIYYSMDNGDSWTPTDLRSDWILSLVENAVGDLFAGTFNSSIYRSSDSGETWTQIHRDKLAPARNFWSLATNSNGDIFTGSDEGVFRSVDNGDSWTQIGDLGRIRSLVINSDGHLFAGNLSDGVYRSNNNGITWQNVVRFNVYDLFISADGDLFAGENSAAYHSSDNGDTWSKITTGLTHTPVQALTINRSGHIFAGTRGGGVFRSADPITSVQEISTTIPSSFALEQNYPNPFNPTTTIQFTLAKGANVKLAIYNLTGQKVATLVNKEHQPGTYSVRWDGKDESGSIVASGVYTYRLEAPERTETRKLVLIR